MKLKKLYPIWLLIILFAGVVITGCVKKMEIELFLIDLNKPDKTFAAESKKTGCGDRLISIRQTIPLSENYLETALEKLFILKDNIPDGLYNALNLSDLTIKEITINQRKAVIHLSGSYALAGSCSGSRFVDQIKSTVLQFPEIDEADIFINDRALEEFAN